MFDNWTLKEVRTELQEYERLRKATMNRLKQFDNELQITNKIQELDNLYCPEELYRRRNTLIDSIEFEPMQTVLNRIQA